MSLVYIYFRSKCEELMTFSFVIVVYHLSSYDLNKCVPNKGTPIAFTFCLFSLVEFCIGFWFAMITSLLDCQQFFLLSYVEMPLSV